jgi:histidinol-phosphate/aromatic aminotransferase/cobyric acid decarboxylase-like protein
MDSFSPVTPAIAHGGLVASELESLQIDPSDVLDLSVNVNPYGPCPQVRDAIAGADLQRYPDPTATPARRALAEWLGVSASRVVVGNGAVDLLWTLARACLGRDDSVLTVEPTFSEMRAAAMRVGARVESFRTDPARDFALDLALLDAQIARLRPRLAYVCSPSNPVGRAAPLAALAALAERHPETLFVVDVSFLSLSAHHADASVLTSRAAERVIWLRSLTKDHALAGLRIGCAIAPPHVARRIEEERPPWSVNALAQAAAIAITSGAAADFVATSRARLLADRERLEELLRRFPVRVHPSDTIFSLVDLGEARAATMVRATLLRDHRVLVRDCTSFGLPHHLRIAARPPAEQDRFGAAFTQVLGK